MKNLHKKIPKWFYKYILLYIYLDRAKTVEFLIQKGANVNIVNSVNETALYYAIKSKSKQINSNLSGMKTIYIIFISDMRIIELLVFGGADINGTGLARKPIFLAINFGN